jgi:hypothetical protein
MMPAFSSVFTSTRKMLVAPSCSRDGSRRLHVHGGHARDDLVRIEAELGIEDAHLVGRDQVEQQRLEAVAAQSLDDLVLFLGKLRDVRSAQIFPNLWWKASSVMTSCVSFLPSGSSRARCKKVAKAPMARPSTSICMPMIFL